METRPQRAGWLTEMAQWTVTVGLVYAAINFIMTPNEFFPVHQDDYVFLGAGWENLTLFIERPVTMNIAYLTTILGGNAPFYAVSFLVAAFPALTLIFTSLLFKVRFSIITALCFAVICFSHFASFEGGKYLGFVGMWSAFFGPLAMIAFLFADSRKSVPLLVVGLLLFALSAFAKEDFLLPPLMLLCFLALPAIEDKSKRWRLDRLMVCGVVGAILISAASAVFSALLKSRFASVAGGGNGSAYEIDASAQGVLTTFYKLTFEYIWVETWLAIAAFCICLVVARGRRMRVLLFFAIILALILPYSLIPNNLPEYRVFGWLPWMAALVALAAQLVIDRMPRVWLKAVVAVAIIPIVAAVYYVNMERRQIIAYWYKSQQAISREIHNSLERDRDRINSQKVVGVRGLPALSPWSNNNGAYLSKALGFGSHWLVFADETDLFYQVGSTRGSITILPDQDRCKTPDLLVLQFDKNGIAAPVSAGSLCP